jgi:hypothetical protein
MKALSLPNIRVASVLLACARSLKDTDLADRLSRAAVEIAHAEHEYILKGQSDEIYKTRETTHAGQVSVDEMSRIYDGTLARRGSAPRRQYYDVIKAFAPHRICPFCGHMTISTLDHYLPK